MNCFNGEEYLREAIDSVYAQTYENWEIIFWDNASIDKSENIARSYNHKLRYFRGEENIPLGAARNKALEKCNGAYIGFLDVDDLWLPEKLEIQIEMMQKNPETIFCYSDGYEINFNEKTKNKFSSHPNVKFFDGAIFKKLILSNFINWQTVLIQKNLAGNDLYFNEQLNYAEDYEILLRLSLNGNVLFTNIALIFYRLHDDNMTLNYAKNLKESLLILDIFKNEIIHHNINVDKALSNIYGSLVVRLLTKNKDYKKFTNYLIDYPNIQNILIFFLIKFKMQWLIKHIINLKRHITLR